MLFTLIFEVFHILQNVQCVYLPFSMSFLFKLSKYIVIPIICEWLTTAEFIELDTSIACNNERLFWLDLIINYNNVFSNTLFPPTVDVPLSLLLYKWIKRKGMSVSIMKKVVFLNSTSFESNNEMINMCSSIDSLSIACCNKSNISTLCHVLSFCSQLTNITINIDISSEVLLSLSNFCPNLTSCSLPINSSNVEAFSYLCRNCCELSNLDINLKVGEDYLLLFESIVVHCRQLKYLTGKFIYVKSLTLLLLLYRGDCGLMQGLVHIQWKILLEYFGSKLKILQLTHFSLKRLPGDKCPNLVELQTPDGFWHENYSNLTSLKFLRNQQVKPDVLLSISQNCKKLRILHCDNAGGIDSEVFEAICNANVNLCDIALGNLRVSSIGLVKIASQYLCLKSLDIGFSWQVVDIIPSVPLFRKVTDLMLRGFDTLQCNGLIAISNYCINLVSINLSYCVFIRDSGMVALLKSCSSLVSVNISYCDRLTDDTLLYMTMYSKLRELNCIRCQRITLEGIQDLLLQLHSLRCLKAEYESLYDFIEKTNVNICFYTYN